MIKDIFKLKNKNISFNFKKQDYLIIAAFFFIVLAVLCYTFFYPNYYDHTSPYKFKVTKGATINQIIDSLYDQKVIPNKFNMKIAIYLSGKSKVLKAGNYYIPNGLNYFDLIDLFVNQPHALEVLVAIPEGIWQYKLAAFLHIKLGIDSAKFMDLSNDQEFIKKLEIDTDNLEGRLLPEGYYFFADASAQDIIKKLKFAQDRIFVDSVLVQMKKLKMSREQILTLASIIDGESNDVKEFGVISGVYHNRLKIKMPLQADPTIQYIVRDKRNGGLYRSDFQIESPFNTYLHFGLPPRPINNPGKEAIMAALYPQKHNYLYFVADGIGSHVFANSFSEHEKNVMKYRKWLRSK